MADIKQMTDKALQDIAWIEERFDAVSLENEQLKVLAQSQAEEIEDLQRELATAVMKLEEALRNG